MIKTFKCKETERLFEQQPSRQLPESIWRPARRKLVMLHAASVLGDLMAPPSNRLEKLRGKRNQQYSIRINRQWRICFEWCEGDALNVEIVDYH